MEGKLRACDTRRDRGTGPAEHRDHPWRWPGQGDLLKCPQRGKGTYDNSDSRPGLEQPGPTHGTMMLLQLEGTDLFLKRRNAIRLKKQERNKAEVSHKPL